MAHAHTSFVIASTGVDTNPCSSALPCVSSSRTYSLMSPGDTTYIMNPFFGEYRGSTNPYACIDTANWGSPLMAATSDYFYFIGQGTKTITNGCSTPFLTVTKNWVWFQSMTFINGSGDKAVHLVDVSSCVIADVYIKDGVRFSDQYNNVVEFSGSGSGAGTKDSVWRRGLIAGRGKYLMMVGGTNGYSERNLIDGLVTRWDGVNSSNPSGDISLYGDNDGLESEPGGVDGARSNIVRNAITLDSNPNSKQTGGENHHMWYHPHSAIDNKWISNVAVHCSTCVGDIEGWMAGENDAARNELWNSVMWGIKKNPFFSGGFTSSITVRNVTIYGKENAQDYHNFSTPNYENIHRWYTDASNEATKSGVVSLSSGANAGDTNGAVFNPFSQSTNTLLITSPTVPGMIGTGIGNADRGAKIVSLAGDGFGTFASTFSKKIHSNVARFPIANDWAIKSVLCSSITANPTAPDATGNLRGVCASTHSISWYILTQLQSTCPDGLCPETQSAQGGGGGEPPPVILNPKVRTSGNQEFRGNFVIR